MSVVLKQQSSSPGSSFDCRVRDSAPCVNYFLARYGASSATETPYYRANSRHLSSRVCRAKRPYRLVGAPWTTSTRERGDAEQSRGARTG